MKPGGCASSPCWQPSPPAADVGIQEPPLPAIDAAYRKVEAMGSAREFAALFGEGREA